MLPVSTKSKLDLGLSLTFGRPAKVGGLHFKSKPPANNDDMTILSQSKPKQSVLHNGKDPRKVVLSRQPGWPSIWAEKYKIFSSAEVNPLDRAGCSTRQRPTPSFFAARNVAWIEQPHFGWAKDCRNVPRSWRLGPCPEKTNLSRVAKSLVGVFLQGRLRFPF